MAQTNRKAAAPVTHEGGPARHISPKQQLERTLNACLLWEDTFYEDGASVADRIRQTVAEVDPETCAALALKARTELHLRHAPLLVAVAMTASPKHQKLVGELLGGKGPERGIIQRPDELGEFLSLYWGNERRPVAAQVKRGLARAVTRFNAYQLAKWRGTGDRITLRDVLRLTHPKPMSDEQAALFKGIIDGTLTAPDTWEVALSAGANKRATFERLMAEKALPEMAFLMNLRNMLDAGIPATTVAAYCDELKFSRVLPFRFITAERHAPAMSDALERAIFRATSEEEKLPGLTAILVDVSGSMEAVMSNAKGRPSEATRMDAACAVAIHAREICSECAVYTFSERIVQVPNRRGFGLRDTIVGSQQHGGTYLGAAVQALNGIANLSRIIVLTDEQSADSVPNPAHGVSGYVVNVAPYKYGVGYGPWTHIDGFSASVIRYIVATEGETLVS